MKMLEGNGMRVGCHANEPVSGKVVIVRSAKDLPKVEAGDILVAHQTDVNYTPQMLSTAAVITEEGGRYSHAATFSRENNIPCVIGVAGIVDTLQDGDQVTINTQAKTIAIH